MSATEQERGHVLVVTLNDDATPEDPYFNHQVECIAPAKCGGWQECLEPHKVDGKSAANGPWEADAGDPWFEQDEFEFHGVVHEWRYGFGWTVPFEGCVVAANDGVRDEAHDIGRDRGPGRYLVGDDWADTTCYLEVVEKLDEPEGATR